MSIRNNKICLKLIAIGALGLISNQAYANGLFLPQQNVTNLGMAYAGTASLAEDASTSFYNPAGIHNINADRQLVVGAVFVDPRTLLYVSSANNTTGGAIGGGLARPDNRAIIPNFHFTQKINNNWAMGLSLVSTFGSKTNYAEDSIVRFAGTKSEMITVNFAPSISYKFNNNWSFAAGPDILHSSISLDKMLSTGTGYNIKHRGKDNAALGYHLSLLYKLNKNTRFGLTYRSDIVTHYKGHADTFTTTVTRKEISSKIHLPESVNFSAYHEFNPTWAVMGDFQWIRSSRTDKIYLDYADGVQVTFDYNYKNSFRAAVGTTYNYNDNLQLKFGVSFDRTPTKNRTRVISLPEHNQVGVGFGAKYKMSKNFIINAAFVRVFTNTAQITQTAATVTPGAQQTAETVNANSKILTNVFGLQFTYNID